MAMSPLTKREREELELLMPWYVNGTLDRESAARLEAALPTDPALARSLAILREDQEATLALAEEDELPASMEQRFLAQLEATAAQDAQTAARGAGAQGSLLARLGTWLGELAAAASPRALAVATVAACLLVAVQAGVIVSMLGPSAEQGGFSTASGEGEQGGAVYLVQFAPGADLSAIATFLDENGARIVDGPLPGGMFKLQFKATDGRGGEELSAVLRAQPQLFQLVLPGG